ncbi:MAG: hypothetical protein RL204_355 [Bacteroidota bacterium]|jgi:predicted transcriptional regulator
MNYFIIGKKFFTTAFLLLVLCFLAEAQMPQYEWANTLRALTSDFSLTSSSGTNDIAYDNDGNVYTGGHFYGSIDGNAGSGTTTLAAASSGIHAYIIKNSADGGLVWAKAFQGTGTAEVISLSVDASGNVYSVGRFSNTVDFDPGSGTSNITSTSNYDMFVSKLDISGNFVWAKKLSGSTFISPSKVAIDPSGNPIYVGYFSGTVDFNPNAGATNLTGSSNSFVLKLDATGNFVFVKSFVATSANSILDIEINTNGDMLLAGYFTSNTDFDPGTGVAQQTVNSNSQDAFICKLDNSGNYLWATKIGGPNSDQINGIDTDPNGNILVTGSFRNYVDFDPGAGSFVMQTSGSTLDDIFIAKYSPTSAFIWARQIGSADGNYTDEDANDIGVDPSGNVVIVGFYYESFDFNPGPGTFTMTTNLNRNTFVVGLNSLGAFNYAFDFDMVSLGGSESYTTEIDGNGNIYVGGYTDGTCDMNPNIPVNNIVSDDYQAFLLKLNPPSSEASFALPTTNGCVGSSLNLVSTYSALQSAWTWTSTGGSIASPNSPNTTISFSQSGSYTITLTTQSDLGLTTYSQNVNVYVGPTLEIDASPAIICDFTSTTIFATYSTGTFSWNTGQTSSILTISPTETTEYIGTVTASNGCATSSSITIYVIDQVVPVITVSDNNICNGETVTLTASGALYYTWNNGSTSPSITVSPSSTTNYTVTGEVDFCDGSTSQLIQVSAAPTIAITSTSNSVCNGSSVTLTATGGTSYLWSTGQTGSSITVTPTATTTYTVTGTNAAGCSNNASKTITIGTTPTINISASNNTPCAGTFITLTATGGTSYLWGTGQTTNAITVSPTVNTTYTVTGTNASGCSAVANKVINVDPVPTVAVTSTSNSICAGASVSLTASGASSYMWSSGQNTATINVSPTTTTTYTATGTNSDGCTGTATKTITVNPLPTVSIQSTSNTICNGNSIVLTGNGAASYSWNTGATSASITVSPTSTTTYTITGTSAAGCTNTATKTITVSSNPTVNITSSNNTICAGTTITLTATSGLTYSWSTGQNTSVISVSPTTNTTYTVTGTNASGCSTVANTSITVNPIPTVSIQSAGTTICEGSSIVLTAIGADSYTWNGGQNTSSITVSPTVTTTYTATGTNAFGCQSTVTKTITVDQLPNVAIQSASNSICLGNSITLSGSGAILYSWNTGASSTNITVSPTTNTTYTVTGTSASGCQNTASTTITVEENPVVEITASATTVCSGNPITLSVAEGLNYAWSNGENSASITVTPSSSSTYSVTATNSAGCSATASVELEILATPTLAFTVSDDAICNGESTTITASGADNFEWNIGNTEASITVQPTLTTVYTVTGTNDNGCQAISSQEILVQQIPEIAFIEPITTFCLNSPEYTIEVLPANGVFSGPGMNGNTFNPAAAGVGTHSIQYYYSNGECDATSELEITVDDCISTNDIEATSISVYPNPATEMLTIDGLIGSNTLHLINEQGQIIFNERTFNAKQNIELQHLTSGIYYLKIQSDQRVQFKKVVVSH